MRGYLDPGEEVRLEARPHGAALAGPLARALVMAVAGAVLVAVGLPLAWGLGAVGALLLTLAAVVALVEVWRWDRTQLVVTTEKVFVVHGVAQRRAAAVRLDRVGAVEMEQGPFGQLFGYGTLVAGNLEIPYVPSPGHVRALLG